jgi:hypothetical protein
VKAIRNFDLHEVIVWSQFSSRTCETSFKRIRLWCGMHDWDSILLNRFIEISSSQSSACSLLVAVYLIRFSQQAVSNTIFLSASCPWFSHGCEMWSLTLRKEHRLRVSESRVLRRKKEG